MGAPSLIASVGNWTIGSLGLRPCCVAAPVFAFSVSATIRRLAAPSTVANTAQIPLAEQGANKDNHCIVKRRHLDAHTNATAVRQVGSSLMVL
jgi:hypothetical protein